MLKFTFKLTGSPRTGSCSADFCYESKVDDHMHTVFIQYIYYNYHELASIIHVIVRVHVL